jgi:hypothetical protein
MNDIFKVCRVVLVVFVHIEAVVQVAGVLLFFIADNLDVVLFAVEVDQRVLTTSGRTLQQKQLHLVTCHESREFLYLLVLNYHVVQSCRSVFLGPK